MNTKNFDNTNKFIPKYWWNDKIQNLWNIKKAKLRLFNIFTKIEYKKYAVKLKLEIKKSKKNKFIQFTEEINPFTNIKTIYIKTLIYSMIKEKNVKNNILIMKS